MNSGYVAGFVCQYSRPELMWRYLLALVAVSAIAYGIYYFTIRRIRSDTLRISLTMFFVPFSIMAWHILYVVYIGGNLFGCSISPLLRP